MICCRDLLLRALMLAMLLFVVGESLSYWTPELKKLLAWRPF
ncbi:hypothetical protein CLU93_5254 [Janthinobacterium sp. 35]|jgi:hypothetical protein|nr:hypothetical protein [Janthinobacterium lividum]PIG30908.1 hypothetical protein CLU93_5254 [Janthinobacterium sp. 35]